MRELAFVYLYRMDIKLLLYTERRLKKLETYYSSN